MDEKLKVYDDKMTKTINNLGSELAAIRAGRANPHVLEADSGLLWSADSDPAGSEHIRTGSTHDPDTAMGKEHVKRNRKSNPDV